MLLEVLTRCYKRPRMLAANQASLDAQTDDDWQQTLLVDDVGRGIAWSYQNLAAYAPNLEGDYIWLLDDDDVCIHPTLFAELRVIAEAHSPDVIFVRMDHGERGVLPNECWGCEPKHGDIGCSAYVVRRQVWQAHAKHFGAHYAGDFDFIRAIWNSKPTIFWHDVIASRVQRISRGATE